MFNEYTLRPEARGKVILNTALQGCLYFVSALFVYLWLRFLEPERLVEFSPAVYLILGFLALASMILMIRLYTAGIKFRMITTDKDFQFTRLNTSITVNYADITRIERTPENILLIYTVSSATRPVVAVSDSITDRLRFEETLSQFIPITDTRSTPLQLRTVPRLLFTYIFISGMFLNLISQVADTVIGSGILVLGLSLYSIVTLIRFRHEIKTHSGVVVMIFLAIIILTRIYLALQPGVFPNHIS